MSLPSHLASGQQWTDVAEEDPPNPWLGLWLPRSLRSLLLGHMAMGGLQEPILAQPGVLSPITPLPGSQGLSPHPRPRWSHVG